MGAGHAHVLHVHGHTLVHRLAPHVKIVATVAFAASVATVPNRSWGAFVALSALVGGAVVAARLPPGFVATRALVVLPFVAFAALVPFVAEGHDAAWGPLSWSSEGAWAGVAIAWRSVLGVTASIVLAGTTELPRLLDGLQRLRVPPAIVSIASFMLRYLEIVGEEFGRMRRAMVARGHDPRWAWQLRPLATASGALFVRTYERGERVHLAMQARGWSGSMPPLRDEPPAASPVPAVVWAAVAVGVAAAAQVLA